MAALARAPGLPQREDLEAYVTALADNGVRELNTTGGASSAAPAAANWAGTIRL